MNDLPILFRLLTISAIVLVGIMLAVAPIFWIARQILAPIDRAAKFRKAPVRFSIGDFLCLFLAIQIPLAGAHRFLGEETMEAYWTFTIITWFAAPVIWYAGARTLSKAQVTTNSPRFVFLGLIMPLVYYGLVPFTVLGLTFLSPLAGRTDLPFRLLLSVWFFLAVLFYLSGRFVRWMLQQVPSDQPPISDQDHENEIFRAAMFDSASAASGRGAPANK